MHHTPGALRGVLVVAVLLASLVGAEAVAQQASRSNYDAFIEAAKTARPLPPSPALRRLLDAGVDMSLERAMGVPTVYQVPAGQVTPVPAGMKQPVDAARWALKELGPLYGLSDATQQGLDAQVLHDTGFGGIIVRFTQSINGVEVHRHRLNVLLERSTLAPVALSGYVYRGYEATAPVADARFAFAVPQEVAIQQAILDRHGDAVDLALIKATGQQGPYGIYALEPSAVAGLGAGATFEAIRVKPVFFGLVGRLEPGWYLELISSDSAAPRETWAYVISARDGRLLERRSLDVNRQYRVWADPTTGWPLDSPLGTALTPLPPGVSEADLTNYVDPVLIDVPMGFHAAGDPWLPPDATETIGNNVDAYADLTIPDGFNDGDVRGLTSAMDVFGQLYVPTLGPQDNAEQTLASAQHLFYVNNFLHDAFYEHGFDELSGNAQVDNFGRGGLGDDPINAEAQDFGGLNNANMSTPADGGRPRMQMFLWNQSSATLTLSGNGVPDGVNTATFGPQNFDLTGECAAGADGVAPVQDLCEPVVNSVAGKIVLADRGTCSFSLKVLNAQDAGAIGVILINNQPGPAPGMSAGIGADQVVIPVLSVTSVTGAAIRAAVQSGPVTATLHRLSSNADGTLDNNIVSHEWGHYMFGRLTGAGTNQSGGLNEGNSDVVAFLMSVREEDVMVPGNDQWQGAYPQGSYAFNNFQQGLRRAPYSTDPTVNGLTFAHIVDGAVIPDTFPWVSNGVPNSEVHNTGEVWAAMMWEVFAALLQQHPFEVARARMMDYLVASLKLSPAAPTFVELRDATLMAIAAADLDDFVLAWQAFSRRGIGSGAVAPDRDSNDNAGVAESFILAQDIALTDLTLTDDLQGCDGDGVLDVGELGALHLSMLNNAPLDLLGATITLSASVPGITFPDGNSVSLPTVPLASARVVDLPVFVADGAMTAETVEFTVEVTAPDLVEPVVRTLSLRTRVNTDEVVNSRTDDVEPQSTSWTVTWDQTTEGFAEPTPFQRTELAPDDFSWFAPGFGSGRSDQYLTSPPLEVSATGGFIFSFSTAWSFESDVPGGIYYDAGVLELTNDGGQTWIDVGDLVPIGYNGQVTDLGPFNANPLANRTAWVDVNPSYPDFDRIVVDLGARFQGQTLQIRFRAGTDPAAFGLGWAIDDLVFENIDNAPFVAFEPNRGLCLDAPPIANAGPDVSVQEGDEVTLDGSGSMDPWLRGLTFSWRQLDGPAATLAGADTATLTFTAPDVQRDATLTFGLVVMSADGRVGVEDVTVVTVRYINQRPIADAGLDAEANEGATVTLDGTGSTDADGDTLTYVWTQTEGPATRLSDPAAASPTFVAPEVAADTVARFLLVVSDGIAQSAPGTVDVLIHQVNKAPVADAGDALVARALDPVVLDGSASTDPDGDTLTFAWTQTEGPDVTFDDAAAERPGFEAPSVHTDATLTFDLVVSDGTLSSAPATATVTLLGTNARPVADAGLDGESDEGATVTLDGSASADADADPLAYTWSQLAGPGVTLDDPNAASPTFVAPEVATDATLRFQLLVSDGSSLSDPDTVEVLVRQVNLPPTANAGDDQSVAAGAAARLDGADSADPDGDTLTFAWTQTEGPDVTLDDATAARPRFDAPAVDQDATLTFELVVDDGTVSSAADTVQVHVLAPNGTPVADAGAAQTVDEGAGFQLDGSASADPEGDALTFIWTQTDGPAAAINGADGATPSVVAPMVTDTATLRFQLLVSDGRTLSAPATVEITVDNVNTAPIADAGADRTITEYETVILDGSDSADPDGDALTFAWTQTEGPDVELSNANSATPSFEVPAVSEPTTMRFSLVVSDGALTSAPATVELFIDNIAVGSVQSDGCSCSTASHTEPIRGLWLGVVGVLGLVGLLRRRR